MLLRLSGCSISSISIISLHWDVVMLYVLLFRPHPKHKGRAPRQLSQLVI